MKDEGVSPSARTGDDTDELELWQSSFEERDDEVRGPISHWHERRRRYPRISRMALDSLTIQPMSAECERLFCGGRAYGDAPTKSA